MDRPVSGPNVLVIMSDQHHARRLGCAGDPVVQTPALDSLASRGVRFANAYCSFPLCGPARMSFLTGRLPSRIDCQDNLAQLSSDVPTFAHAFTAANYDTVLAGRMHIVGPDQRHGFLQRLVSDVTTAYCNRDWALGRVLGGLADTPGYSRQGLLKSGPGHTGYHAYDETVRRATVEWLRARGEARARGAMDRPFLLTVGFVSPHCPFVAPPADYDLYRGRIAEADLPAAEPARLHPVLARQRAAAGLDTPEPVPAAAQLRARRAYYGLCTFLDRQVGLILDALRDSGLERDTLVVYTSDHGEQLGEHGLWWKTTFYEGAVAVPLLLAGPGLPAGDVVTRNVSLMDIGPTLLDLAGCAPLPATDGRSVRCLLERREASWPDEAVAECFDACAQPPAMRMLRRGPWKLCCYHGCAPQLFHLAEDPGEDRDLADDPAHADVLHDLLARVRRDWEPERIEERMRRRRETELPLIRQWLERLDPPEPDPLWYTGSVPNSLNPA